MNAKKEAVPAGHEKDPIQSHCSQDRQNSGHADSKGRVPSACSESGTGATTQEEIARHELLFGVRMSIRYHSKRQGFFEGADQLSNFLLLVLSSGAIAAALKGWPETISIIIGIGIAAATSIRIAFRVSSRAALHSHFVTEYTNLERLMLVEDELMVGWDSRLEIEAEEPPTLINLSKVCHNEEIASQGLDPSYILKVSWFQRLMAPVFDFKPYQEA